MSDILHRVGIDAKPDKVFNALTTIEGLRGWWSGTATGSAAKGGLINYGFCDMQVIAAEPNKLVHWRCTGGADEWLNTEVTFRLVWKEGQTFVLSMRIGKSRSNSCTTAARSGRRSCLACGTGGSRKDTYFRMTSRLPSMVDAGRQKKPQA